jgi:TRAP-type C4-dicarboxylate transport system substrate-binding protein
MYYAGVAGSELDVLGRVDKGQIDGSMSGGPMCMRLMPSMRIQAIIGLFQSQDEAYYTINKLNETLEKEARSSGYILLGVASVGPQILFSRKPVATVDELRRTPVWGWDMLDAFNNQIATEFGMKIVATPLPDAMRAFDSGKIDGFWTTPIAALAFQWYTRTPYLTDLRIGYLMGCFMLASRAMDRLAVDEQAIVKEAATRLFYRVEDDERRQDKALLGGIFKQQGVTLVPVKEKKRAEFFEAARVARERQGDKLVSKELLNRVLLLLADYRAEHPR